jgi:hypothetical protein
MLIRRRQLEAMAAGEVTLAFRRWRRPTVKAGGSLTTALGVLAIDAVTAVDESAITTAEARRAGYGDRDELLHALARGTGTLYRIELHRLASDPRIALREDLPDPAGLERLAARLQRMDRAGDPWTHATLAAIRDRPQIRAGDLATALGVERDPFKRNVRKLKNLGLTESLEVGYRLSPRGHALLEYLVAR